jgi:hypothetical protein
MAKKKRGKKKPTVITLTLPDEGGIQQTGSLLIQRGDLAKVFQFHYCNTGDITSAIKDATKALASLEKFPPIIPEASKDKSSTKGRATKKATPAPKDDEPTVDLPTKNGTVAVKISYLKIISGDTDAAAYRKATLLGARLIDAGLWDGQSPIRIKDVHATYASIEDFDDNVLGVMTLPDVVQIDDESDEQDAPDTPTTVDGNTVADSEPATAAVSSSDDDGPQQLTIL